MERLINYQSRSSFNRFFSYEGNEIKLQIVKRTLRMSLDDEQGQVLETILTFSAIAGGPALEDMLVTSFYCKTARKNYYFY